ncbi:MAG: polyprenyl synthetase family protein [Planctomycetota bacterium]|nr:MAG: polyprenyl synthetase family protein [Planctomycetota bacterium]
MNSTFPQLLSQWAKEVEAALQHYFKPAAAPPLLYDAMAYSLFAGGKRIRPILAMLGAEICGQPRQNALPAACALECIHVYSLIHDDLPAMDNASLRRGKPANHKVFGEAIGILAGDGLLTYAFELLAEHYPQNCSALVLELAKAAGPEGMVGGQTLDMIAPQKTFLTSAFASLNFQSPPSNPPQQLLERIHRLKTGALLKTSIKLGALVAQAPKEQLDAIEQYGHHLGLAFQIVDDILDTIGANTGKTATDLDNQKLTYPALFGLETSKNLAQQAYQKAIHALEIFPNSPAKNHLENLAKFVVEQYHTKNNPST